MIKRYFPIVLLAAGLQTGWSFSLLGPPGNGGDAWQTSVIGYNLAYLDESFQTSPGGPVFLGDIGGPKNIGEGYRRNAPILYYAYDANFLGFFGSDGATATDGAFAIMNSLNNVSSYSSDLSEFPLTSQHFNERAQALYLTDIKSVTLHLLLEQMGLASPERFTWTLAERVLPPGGTCPFDELYLVLQRNFAISPTGSSQIQYSSYVNDVLYSYLIVENCTGPNPLAFTVPFAVDPEAEEFTSVAANNGDGFGGVNFSFGGGLQVGGFYTGLTRDDVAGLRYLLRANNINRENAAAGSLLLATNLPPPQLITTFSLGLFLSQAKTNDPATLQGLYPGLLIASTVTNYSVISQTNLFPYFTNQPGPSITNFQADVQLWTNYDLGLFSLQALTNDRPTLQALYPDLVILSSTRAGFFVVSNPVVTVYLTNQNGAPAGSPPKVVTLTNYFTFSYLPYYNNTFGNILTNYYSPSNKVTIQTITVTNLVGSPAGSPQSTNIVTVNKYLTNQISGEFLIVPTNWCGYTILQNLSVQKVPSFTNILVGASTTNTFGAAQFSQNTIYYFTNRVFAVQPGVCEPSLVFGTNFISGIVVTNYSDVFLNIFTNSFSTNTFVTITTTNIGACSNGIAGTLCTNITQVSFYTNIISGDFFIVPPEWNCGYSILSTQAVNQVGITNTVTATIPPGVPDIGQQYSVTTISYYTNRLLVIQPVICQTVPAPPALRQGIEKVQFKRANFDSLIGQFFQPITNTYTMIKVTNSQPVTEYYQRVITQPDILLSADNFIGANTFNGSVSRSIRFDTGTVLANLAGPGVINSSVAFNYNKIGSAFRNGSMRLAGDTNQFLSELTHYTTFAWASFDSSTNEPEVYPNGASIDNLGNLIYVQISPAPPVLVNGANGVPYPTTTFAATGGSFSPPFTWSTPTGLPPGLTLSAGGTISGTPTQSGTFDFIIQLTDSLSRTVQWTYSITIQ